MHIIEKMKKLFMPIWRNPDVSNMWSITHIENRVNFMRFVFMNSAISDIWRFELVFDERTIDLLKQFMDSKGHIPLKESTVEIILNSLRLFNFNEDFVHQMIFDDKHVYFVGYDNLSDCWISKRIAKDHMIEASKDYSFTFD